MMGRSTNHAAANYRATTHSIMETLEARQMLSVSGPAAGLTSFPPSVGVTQSVTPLTAPSSLRLTISGPSTVTLDWTNNDPTATGYLVQRSSNGTTFTTIATLTAGNITSYTDTSALSGRKNYYRICATAGTTKSAYTPSTLALTPMAASTGLMASAPSGTSVKLTWGKNDPGATSLAVLRSTNGGPFVKIATLGNVLTWTDNSVSPSTNYQYQIQASNVNVTANPSTPVSIRTPLGSVANLLAAATAGQVKLTWKNTDPTAAGYYINRSLDGKTFTRLATVTDPAATSFIDTSVATGTNYTYVVQTYAPGAFANSLSVKSTVPVGIVTGLSAQAVSTSSVTLNWTNNDLTVTGYYILRATDGITFTRIATVNLPLATTYTDATNAPGIKYSYRVQAVKGTITATNSAIATAVTPLISPANLTATASGMSIKLAWTNPGRNASGYYVLRSTDNATFKTVATIKSSGTLAWTDTQVGAGQTYYYQIQAYNAVATSAPSATASATPNGTTVSISTRYNNELVITANGISDSISITQSGAYLSILADGQLMTLATPGAGIFIYTRGGTGTINIDSSVATMTTIESIDAANTTITSAGSHVSVWMDSTDSFTGSGAVHRIASFAGGVAKTTGAALKNPTDAGTTKKVAASLWGTGPVTDDVNQGSVGDCYFMATLAAFANTRIDTIRESAVDMGDGTFAVQYFNPSGVASYVRVSNDFSVGGFSGGLKYANLGSSGSIWAMVMEKAFAYFRTGANTYASISGGWMGSVYTNLGVANTWEKPANFSDSALDSQFANALSTGKPITLATFSYPPNLVGGHAYTLISVSTDSNGINHYTVRNPWGVKGGSAEDSDGFATLTYAQLTANFSDIAIATA